MNFLFPMYFGLQLGRRIHGKMLCGGSTHGKGRVARKGMETVSTATKHAPQTAD